MIKAKLTTFDTTMIVVSLVIGIGIFRTPAIVASTLFVLRHKAGRRTDYRGFRVPLYPVLPAVFVVFLFGISMNVLITQTRSALFGAAIMASGLPVFLLMRRVSRGN